jgi:nicotinamidase-related amidase
MTLRNGLSSLLRPEDSVLVLIDHQAYQLANLNSHDPHMVINNTTGLAKAAKVFGVPTILTSVIAERGGLLFPQITDVFPGQEVIDRTMVNTWEDKEAADAVKVAECQRDWARLDTAVGITEVIKQHGGGSGIAYLWEQQLLNTPVPG